MTYRFEWTDGPIEKLRGLAADKLSGQQIADELTRIYHSPISRGSVIGKASRAGIKIKGATRATGAPRIPDADFIGITYGRLTVLRRDGQDKFENAAWLCLCACGREHRTAGKYLRNGRVKSCGCLVASPRAPATSRLTGSLTSGRPTDIFAPRSTATPVDIVCEPMSLLDLRDGRCKWVLDQRCVDGLRMYCGAGTEIGRSYCDAHHRMVFVPAQARRRAA